MRKRQRKKNLKKTFRVFDNVMADHFIPVIPKIFKPSDFYINRYCYKCGAFMDEDIRELCSNCREPVSEPETDCEK